MEPKMKRSIIIPVVLSGLAMLLGLVRVFVAMPRYEQFAFHLLLYPIMALLVLLYVIWELPIRKKNLMYSIVFVLILLGALTYLRWVDNVSVWADLQLIFYSPFMLRQFELIGVKMNICLLVSYISALILLLESFAKKKRLSKIASILMLVGFLVYTVMQYIYSNLARPIESLFLSFLPQILISLAIMAICLKGLFPAEVDNNCK